VAAVLRLPDPRQLIEDQVRGAVCVWGSERLRVATAVDLGEHTDATIGRWWPRACPQCAAEHAHRALFEHAPMCEQCVDEAGRCEVGRLLYRLIREGRR